jgi:hypothetical protein
LGEKLYGASRINESGIADPEPHSLLVLGHERLTAGKKNEIMICIIKANVTRVALDATGIASGL